jgi:hypothetical protein
VFNEKVSDALVGIIVAMQINPRAPHLHPLMENSLSLSTAPITETVTSH